ncbi:MAG: ABC transporter permease, partial [Holophagales bacterium]|nr:ABC transporter permease [Holophagales bacterium]
LGAAGALLGIGLAAMGGELLRLFGPARLPGLAELRIDLGVLGVAVVVSLASALSSGLTPALRAMGADPSPAVSYGARGSGGSRRDGRARDRLVVAEIALALMLTIGAGLLLRSHEHLMARELGFDPTGLLAVQLWAYDDQHRIQESFFDRGLEELRALPGVEAVGITSDLPLADDRSISARTRRLPFRLAGEPAGASGSGPAAGLSTIDGAYPEAMGIPLRSGRAFSELDHRRSVPVAMVNEAFVRRYLAGRSAIGRHIELDRGPEREIVGVLADVRRRGLASEPRPEIYLPVSQNPSAGLTFVIRTTVEPSAALPAVREALRAADPRQAIWAARPMAELLSDGMRERRFHTALLLAFATLALCLSAVGVYGLMSFSVERRIGELGIRRALGGQARDVLGMVMYRGWVLAASGVGIGLLGALALTRLLGGLLFGVGPLDPLTFVTLSAFVVLVTLLASLIPARRAMRVDPMSVLRAE